MDPSRTAFARYLESKVSALLARVPARHRRTALDPETLSLLRGIAWWMASCILAWLSFESTRKMTLIEYRDSYRPPLAAWESILESNGYSPASRDSAPPPRGSFRVSADLNHVLFPSDGKHMPSGRLWQKKPDPGSPGSHEIDLEWKDRPFNLQGLEAWILELESIPKRARAASANRRAKGGNSIDPREIRY